MNRRAFFSTVAAAFIATKLPAPAAAEYWYRPELYARIKISGPVIAASRNAPAGAYWSKAK